MKRAASIITALAVALLLPMGALAAELEGTLAQDNSADLAITTFVPLPTQVIESAEFVEVDAFMSLQIDVAGD